MLTLDTFPLRNASTHLEILQYGTAQSSILPEALHGTPLHLSWRTTIFVYQQHPTLLTSISKQGCQHKMFAYEMHVHSCTYTPSDKTFTSTYNIFPNVHTPLSVLPNFCTPPPTQKKWDGEKKRQNRKGKKRRDASITFGEMLICMVATPAKTAYLYNIYYQLVARCFVNNYCFAMFWPQFLLNFRETASLLIYTVYT